MSRSHTSGEPPAAADPGSAFLRARDAATSVSLGTVTSRPPRRTPDIGPDPFRGPAWSDRWILPFVREPTLWPVGLVLVAHVVVFLAPLLLLAVRDGRSSAAATLAATALASAWAAGREWRRRGRPGAFGALLGGLWLLSGAGAVLAHHAGLF